MNMNEQRELDWDDEVSRESDFIILPEGDYDFVVESYERGRHNGSDKLPPCNKAIVTLAIDAPEGHVTIKHNLFLHQNTETMLSEFFLSIGLKKKGVPFRMNWTLVPGSKGRLKLGIRTYKNSDGEDRTINTVKRFYPSEGPRYKAGDF